MANAASTGVSAGTSLGETRINSSLSESQKETAITSDSEGVLGFEQSDLGLNLVAASESTILSTITTLLGTTSSNSLMGDGQVAAGSAITDSLIVFFIGCRRVGERYRDHPLRRECRWRCG